ncbi:MAG: thioesterase family protein [Bacteroidota bacterium]
MKLSLNDYKITAEYPVHWGDMDAAKHVNNLVYLRWTESGRLLYFQAMNMDTSFHEVGPILGWQDCKYIFPMTYPDIAIVGARTIEIKTDRIMMETAVFSKKHQRIAAISKQSIIPYNYAELKKAVLPASWRQEIERIEKRVDF